MGKAHIEYFRWVRDVSQMLSINRTNTKRMKCNERGESPRELEIEGRNEYKVHTTSEHKKMNFLLLFVFYGRELCSFSLYLRLTFLHKNKNAMGM